MTGAHEFPQRKLLAADLARSLKQRNLAKPVAAARVIDDMELDRPWTSFGIAQVAYTHERVLTGTRAMRLTCGERDEEYMGAYRQANGSLDGFFVGEAGARLDFDSPEDWSAFNRLALWVYVGPTTIPAINLVLLINRDLPPGGIEEPVPFCYQEDLQVDAWNQLYWDIPEFERSRVTGVEITKHLTGYPGAPVIYDVDRIELQRVVVEPYEGWEVAPEKIAYRHVGYRPGEEKLAVAAPRDKHFELLDAGTGRSMARRAVRVVANRHGRFAVLDFSDITDPGSYVLVYGPARSGAFSIGDDVWRGVVEKALNYFLGARCGFAVPGLHDVCHQDLTSTYEGVTKVITGGWHDAGDAGTQLPPRTQFATYALLQLYDRLAATGSWPDLLDRVLEEAKWGLDYIANTRFAPGVRAEGIFARLFTDNTLGTIDDIEVGAETDATMPSVLASAYAARLLRGIDDGRVAAHLTIAEDDYATAPPPGEASTLAAAAEGAIAATQLWLATGRKLYAQHATAYGRLLINCQQRRFDGLAVTGYFHADTACDDPLNDTHESNQDFALRALRLLAETFPEHPDWILWYGAALLYSEYFHARGAATVEPYRHLPHRVWRESEIAAQQENAIALAGAVHARIRYIHPAVHDHDRIQQEIRAHFDSGVPVGPGARLRINPLYLMQATGRGSNGYLLSCASALVEAAVLRNRGSAGELARMQLQWILGGNPFSQSLMYGEGYDYCPQWANDMSTNVVGALPVGIDATTADTPLWTDKSQMTVKETWVVLPGKLLASLAFLGLPARVTGSTTSTAEFRALRSRGRTIVPPGTLDLTLEPGEYLIEYGGVEKSVTLLGGGSYSFELDHERPLAMRLTATCTEDDIALAIHLSGRGMHEVELRAFNATVSDRVIVVELDGEQTVTSSAVLVELDTPWVIVAIPDRNLAERQEVFGTIEPLPSLI
jgi:hypothetical protein